jgi:hypothetical protein
MAEAERKHRWTMGSDELDRFFRKGRWALFGLVLSLIAYAVLFEYFILPKKSTRQRQLTEDTKNSNDPK